MISREWATNLNKRRTTEVLQNREGKTWDRPSVHHHCEWHSTALDDADWQPQNWPGGHTTMIKLSFFFIPLPTGATGCFSCFCYFSLFSLPPPPTKIWRLKHAGISFFFQLYCCGDSDFLQRAGVSNCEYINRIMQKK